MAHFAELQIHHHKIFAAVDPSHVEYDYFRVKFGDEIKKSSNEWMTELRALLATWTSFLETSVMILPPPSLSLILHAHTCKI